jgi:hypothetical protein
MAKPLVVDEVLYGVMLGSDMEEQPAASVSKAKVEALESKRQNLAIARSRVSYLSCVKFG